MTTPTNWPNPERPGVPMFPERDGYHIILGNAGKNPTVFFWNAQCRRYAYPDMPDGPFMDTRDFYCVGYRYHGPVLTPTQIAEMLAGERERCAKECDEKVAFANHELKASGSHEETRYWIGEHCAATFCADVIRGLGDKA